MKRLVVIGADAAGMAAAANARRGRGPDELEIVVLDRGRYASYSACGIPYWIGGLVKSEDDLIARTVAEHRDAYQLDVRLQTEAMWIDTARHSIGLRPVDGLGGGRPDAPSADAATEWLEYDQLMIATGAVPVRPNLPGMTASGVFGVQTLGDGAAVRAAVEAGVQRAVVVGAGYVGLEMAEAFVQRGIAVTVLTAGTQPMETLDPDMGARVAEAVRGLGIDLRCSAKVDAVQTRDGAAIAVSADGVDFPADVVVLGLGVRPNSDLAAAAGIDVGPSRGIRVQPSMRSTSHSNVFAAGDCVESTHRVSGAPVSIALGTHANKQGRVAGIVIGGGKATFPGVLGTAATKVCDLEIARTGLSTTECAKAGFEIAELVTESTTRAGYYPDAEQIAIKLLAEKQTGRLLGAQIVGRDASAKRIDVFATAIWNEMTVEEISGLDLAYAPPFSPAWDPVLIAARRLHGLLNQ